MILTVYRKIEAVAPVPLYALINTTASTQLHPIILLTLCYYTSVSAVALTPHEDSGPSEAQDLYYFLTLGKYSFYSRTTTY